MASPESPSLSVSRRGSALGDADHTVLWVRGDQDIATKVSLAVAVDRASQLEDVPLLVDLSAVTFMDASTVGAIFGSRNRPRSRAQALGVRAPSPSALRVIELCGLAHLVHREPLRAIGVAGALATWVDVPAIQPSVGADDGSGPVPAGQESRQPLGVLAAAGARSDHATVPLEADSGGP